MWRSASCHAFGSGLPIRKIARIARGRMLRWAMIELPESAENAVNIYEVEPRRYLSRNSFDRKSRDQLREPIRRREVSAIRKNEFLNRIEIPIINGMWLHSQKMWIGVESVIST